MTRAARGRGSRRSLRTSRRGRRRVASTSTRGERVALIGAERGRQELAAERRLRRRRPAAGHVRVDGADVTGRTPGRVVRRGLTPGARGPAGASRRLPVEANLLLGAYGRSFRTEIVTSTLRYLRRRREVRERLERVYAAAAEAVRAPRAPRRAHVGRRAADGRDRPRADGGAARARDRRALARARAARSSSSSPSSSSG